jgi:PKHD-type hydroxylase
MSDLTARSAPGTAEHASCACQTLFTPVDPTSPEKDWRDEPEDFRLVVEVPGMLDSDQCDVLLDYVAKVGQEPGLVGTDQGGAQVNAEVRRVRQTKVPRTPETAWIYDQLTRAIDGCNRQDFGFDLRDFNEDLMIVDYRSGDFYDWHLDVGRGASSRKLSVSVLLSSPDEYEGGALAFPGADFDRVPRGGAVVFPSFLLHGVQPVKRGRRCALLAWVGGPRFR